MGSSFQEGVRNTLVSDDFSREEQLSEAGKRGLLLDLGGQSKSLDTSAQ